MENATDFNLNAMIADWAVEIFEQTDSLDDACDLVHQYADGTEWVIYYHKAHELCANCNTDAGEEFVEVCGEPRGGWTYDGFASAIAFGEINNRLTEAVHGLYEMQEELA